MAKNNKKTNNNENTLSKKLFIANNFTIIASLLAWLAKDIVVLCAAFAVVIDQNLYKEITTVRSICGVGLRELAFYGVAAFILSIINHVAYFKNKNKLLCIITAFTIIETIYVIIKTILMFVL